MTRTPAAPRFAAALSTHADTASAVRQACRKALDKLKSPADLALAFVSLHHGPDFQAVARALYEELGATTLLGCTGEAIVGGMAEVEDEPAISVWAASLPGTSVHPMHLTFQRTSEGGTFLGWPDDLPSEWPAGAALLLLGEPYSFPVDVLLERINEDRPGTAVIGGMASGGYQPGENKLFLNGQQIDAGAVAVLLYGGVQIRTVVSQGCRPIGRPYVITKADRNLILELGGKPPLVQLQELFQTLPQPDRELIQRGLHVGRVINEYQDSFQVGDFLIRNVIGADPQSGALAIADYVRAGQTVQFHLRDAASADQDLKEMLRRVPLASARGALLFTCNGRGTRLFDHRDHDAMTVQNTLGVLPLAGFFAQGELGPVGGRNFIHGYTASLVLIEQKEDGPGQP